MMLERLVRAVPVGTREPASGIYLECVDSVYYVGSDVLGLVPMKTRYHSVAACYYMELIKEHVKS